MITYQDNFLSSDAFQELNTCILNRFDATVKENIITSERKYDPENPIRTRIEPVENEDYTRVQFLLGLPIVSITKTVQEYMINELNILNPKPHSIWIQYMNNTHSMGKHLDAKVRGRPLDKSFTTLLYSHMQWEDNWGGEIMIEDQSYLPKPNRLVVYTRDKIHAAKPILHTDNNYYRLFLGTSWSSD